MNDEYYGQATTADEVKTVQERCREYYKMGKFVVVMNIDTHPFMYQVQRVENQMVSDDGVSQTIVNMKNPERITLQPGQTRLVPAYEADLMVKALIDKIVYSNRHIDELKGNTPKESVMDPSTQHKYIKQIYQGTRDFLEDYNTSINKQSVLDDLDEATNTNAELDRARSEANELRKELAELKAAKEENNDQTQIKRSPGRPPKQTSES
jgi:hypothetical protein